MTNTGQDVDVVEEDDERLNLKTDTEAVKKRG